MFMAICKAPLTEGYSEELSQRDRLVKIKVAGENKSGW